MIKKIRNMAKVVLSGEMKSSRDCPFSNYDYIRDRTFCKLGLSECMAEYAFDKSFNVARCEYVTNSKNKK
jgi:hypothetical protein